MVPAYLPGSPTVHQGGAFSHRSYPVLALPIRPADPKRSWSSVRRAPIMSGMYALAAPSPAPVSMGAGRVMLGTLVGSTLLVGGLAVGWISVATPFVALITPAATGADQTLAGLVAWWAALIAPAAFIAAGTARIGVIACAVHAGRRQVLTPVARVASRLGDDCRIAVSVSLPDGQILPEVVVGRFGVAVVEELPPPVAMRHQGRSWETRGPGGAWIPCESPLDRAARRAQALRRWFSEGDRDFVVKVHAAIISNDQRLSRTPACAVIDASQIPAWLNSLPAQRSLTPARRAKILAEIAGALPASSRTRGSRDDLRNR
jgi:hypothetical protein